MLRLLIGCNWQAAIFSSNEQIQLFGCPFNRTHNKEKEDITMLNLDYKWFQFINGLAGHSALLDWIMTFLSKDAEYLFFLGIILYWFTRSRQNRRMVIEALVSASAALGVSSLIGRLYYRDRPFVDHHVHLLIKHAANASFPSDHATAAFAVATAIWCSRRKEGWGWLILSAGIAISRVWTGVHYPLDIITGAAVGSTAAIIIHILMSALMKRVSKSVHSGGVQPWKS
ncbi:undecaprenyl-diphosphatase [Paenibacillus sp. PR3]|uniref:Undecaprenyl-diphosphatase n=1 Tax=Paenibacillus terricola TaxID=2763503 RepID=A0ABR8MT80_9BACL|nr:undecaprenyl-diphosphatase [Paenibacillus terricola]MBD3919172.1 undecaprenyl-diphosphatase [Paenibacillus terricola]